MNKTHNTCINCLHCVDACKEGLLPNFLFHFAQDEEKEGLEKFGIENCTLCRKCDKVCPANLPLSSSIEELKELAEENKDNKGKKSSETNTNTDKTTTVKNSLIEEKLASNAPKTNLKNFEYIALVALIPLYLGAIGRYGLKVIALLVASLIAGFLTDMLASFLRKDAKIKWNWLAWFLIPLAMPAGVPLWIPVVGTTFALTFGKHLFGGYGKNFVNVIALAAVFVYLSYPAILGPSLTKPFATPTYGFQSYASQVSISAEALKTSFTEGVMSGKDILFGLIPGNIGDSYPLYIVFAGILFFLIGILDYRIPVSSIAGITFFSLIGNAWYPSQVVLPHYQLLVGPVLAVLIFFSMDVWSLPRTPISRWISGFIFAFFVVLIRAFSGNAESVFFALLLTNIFTPIIDWTIGIKALPKKAGAAT